MSSCPETLDFDALFEQAFDVLDDMVDNFFRDGPRVVAIHADCFLYMPDTDAPNPRPFERERIKQLHAFIAEIKRLGADVKIFSDNPPYDLSNAHWFPPGFGASNVTPQAGLESDTLHTLIDDRGEDVYPFENYGFRMESGHRYVGDVYSYAKEYDETSAIQGMMSGRGMKMLEDDLARRQREIDARFGAGTDLQAILAPLCEAPAVKRYIGAFPDEKDRDAVTNRLFRYFEAAAYEGPDIQARSRERLVAKHDEAKGDAEALAVAIMTARAYFQAIPRPVAG